MINMPLSLNPRVRRLGSRLLTSSWISRRLWDEYSGSFDFPSTILIMESWYLRDVNLERNRRAVKSRVFIIIHNQKGDPLTQVCKEHIIFNNFHLTFTKLNFQLSQLQTT
ncbi:hypothetical protein HanPSC8_Chr10g0441501 [Helianthus annuus]|nr:hypothetical protein HanPSC8_Chr10g0441501 [Helianthus annuus]